MVPIALRLCVSRGQSAQKYQTEVKELSIGVMVAITDRNGLLL